MLRRRPYPSDDDLYRTADEEWAALDEADRREAYDAHPRLGDRSLARAGRGTQGWSRREQSGTDEADPETLRALAEGNVAYEERFGRVFLLCATGRTAAEMLDALRERLHHDRETEERIAAEEQRKITQLRLAKLDEEG